MLIWITKMRIYLCFLFCGQFFVSCKQKQPDYIILTNGLSENPDMPRVGIEIRNNELFLCEENTRVKGTYTYYSCKFNPTQFQTFENEINESFKEVNQDNNISDATPYELIYRFNKKLDSIRFYTPFLTIDQLRVVKEIISLKDCERQKINYHSFPIGLLKEKIPEPPPLESTN